MSETDENVAQCFPNPEMTSSNAFFVQKPKDIQLLSKETRKSEFRLSLLNNINHMFKFIWLLFCNSSEQDPQYSSWFRILIHSLTFLCKHKKKKTFPWIDWTWLLSQSLAKESRGLYNLGKIVRDRYKNNLTTAQITQDSIITKWKESRPTHHLTKAGVLTTLRNLQRRSRDELWSENSPTDCSGKTTYCSLLQREILEGQQSEEFLTNLGLMATRPERSHSWENAYEGSTIKADERKWNHEAKDCMVWWNKPQFSFCWNTEVLCLRETRHSPSLISQHPYHEAWWRHHRSDVGGWASFLFAFFPSPPNRDCS